MAAAPSNSQRAKELLSRALKFDDAKRYGEALICYEEAIQILIGSVADMHSESARKERRTTIQNYLCRAEAVKGLIKTEKEGSSDRVHCIQIREGEKGHSYYSVFVQYLDAAITQVDVMDPYIRSKHQVHNFVRFCEMLILHCKSLKTIKLTTGHGDNVAEQEESLTSFSQNLKKHNVALVVTYSSTLHDREIRLGNGWIVKMGRGLDYFQRPEGQFSIGFHNLDLRPCHETTIEIFHKLNRQKYDTKTYEL